MKELFQQNSFHNFYFFVFFVWFENFKRNFKKVKKSLTLTKSYLSPKVYSVIYWNSGGAIQIQSGLKKKYSKNEKWNIPSYICGLKTDNSGSFPLAATSKISFHFFLFSNCSSDISSCVNSLVNCFSIIFSDSNDKDLLIFA